MLSFDGKKIYLSCGVTDMRKSINGLSAIVETKFALNPFDNAVFVFCNRNRDRLKILEWGWSFASLTARPGIPDGDGFWLYLKRLEKGRFRWPSVGDDPTMNLTAEELAILLGGTRVDLKLKRNEVIERKIS